MQRMQPTMATVENNAATMQDATNATNKSTVRNNAATLQDAIMQPAIATIGNDEAMR